MLLLNPVIYSRSDDALGQIMPSALPYKALEDGTVQHGTHAVSVGCLAAMCDPLGLVVRHHRRRGKYGHVALLIET